MHISVKDSKTLRLTVEHGPFHEPEVSDTQIRMSGELIVILGKDGPLRVDGRDLYLPLCDACGCGIFFNKLISWTSDLIVVSLRCGCAGGRMEVHRES